MGTEGGKREGKGVDDCCRILGISVNQLLQGCLTATNFVQDSSVCEFT